MTSSALSTLRLAFDSLLLPPSWPRESPAEIRAAGTAALVAPAAGIEVDSTMRAPCGGRLKGTTMKTRAELVAERDRLETQLAELGATQASASGVREKHNRLLAGVEKLNGQIAALDRERVLAGVAGADAANAIYDTAPARAPRNRNAAMSAVMDTAHRVLEARGDVLSAQSGDRLTRLIDADPTGVEANYIAAVSAEAYERAFHRLVADPTHGHLGFDADEAEAVRVTMRAHQIRAEAFGGGGFQAAALGVGAGDVPTPLTVDPTLIIDGPGVASPIRQLADVRTITGQKWKAATSGEVAASFDAELTEVSDDTPTLAAVEIEPQKAQAWIEYSIETGADWSGASAELLGLLRDAKDNLEGGMFVNGAGEASNEPQGLLTGATVVYTTAATAVLDIADLTGAQEDLDPRFQAGAAWLQNLATLNAEDQLVAEADASNAKIITANGDMLRRPRYEVSDLASIAAGAKPVIYGNVRKAFKIIDRVGLSVELVPVVLGANRRPTGARGMYAYWRVSSKVVLPDALRVITILS